jgi:redox-sensitive bicupin YhaK (pirin superfamily)
MMSWQPAQEAAAASTAGPIEMAILPRTRDLGDGFTVSRVLPFAKRRMVGPFIFFDAMGPTVFRAGSGLDVRPHPHIGLATLTYLFEGELLHRDSLGNVQPIRPGEVNWMVAGSGIAHSERSDATLRQKESRLFGIQSWVALPRAHEETAPLFSHHGSVTLPLVEGRGRRIRLIAGALFGKKAPVETFSPMFYAEVTLDQGERVALPAGYEERGAFLVSGTIMLGEDAHAPGQMLVFRPGAEIVLTAAGGAARFMLLGGDPLDGPRHIWWNFVSSRPERIERAKSDWKNARFARVIGDGDFIPLPE